MVYFDGVVAAEQGGQERTVGTIFGYAILLGLVGVIMWAGWRVARVAGLALRCFVRGEKTPWAKRWEEIEQMRAKIISKEEAMARAREYAKTRRHSLEEKYIRPGSAQLHLTKVEGAEGGEPAERFVYEIAIGRMRPMPIVEVDALDGTILKWRSLPR